MKKQPEQQFFTYAALPFLEVRRTLRSHLNYAEHLHESLSVGVILEGVTRMRLASGFVQAKQGDVVCIPPYAAHSCNTMGDGSRSYVMLYIRTDWLVSIGLGGLQEYPVKGALATGEAICRNAALLAEMLCREVVEPERCTAFLLEVLRLLEARRVETLANSETQKNVPFYQTHAFSEAPVSLQARQAGVRRESYSRAFKRRAGLSPQGVQQSLRLEIARALLRGGESPAQAALAAGYADQSHMNRAFRRYLAVTPGCYAGALSHSYKKKS